MERNKEDTTGYSVWGMEDPWASIFGEYGLPVGQLLLSFLYSIYKGMTVFNVSIFVLKYVPTGCYMYKLVRNLYINSKEKIRRKEMELQDIQIQLQIVKSQLSARDADFAVRAEVSKRRTERLRAVRAHVRDVIASSDVLRRALERVSAWNEDLYLLNGKEIGLCEFSCEGEFKHSLLKDWKIDQAALADSAQQNNESDCKHSDSNVTENTIYASLNDVDPKECQVKIVKVTNIYKMACLKHYIRQKRMRRAAKQTILKKRIEAIKKLLEDWHKTLSRVINMRQTSLDGASQAASQPVRGSSDSDSDVRTNGHEEYVDEYSLSWCQNPYNTYHHQYDYDENAEKEGEFEVQDYPDKSAHGSSPLCDCSVARTANVLFILPEETSSQLAIEEIKNKAKGPDLNLDCRDVVTV